MKKQANKQTKQKTMKNYMKNILQFHKRIVKFSTMMEPVCQKSYKLIN